MKICHITSVHPRYDIRIFVKECVSLTSEHEVALIVADSLGDEQKLAVNIYDVGKPVGNRLQRMRFTSQKIFQKVLQLKPQIVHFHDPELIGIARKLAKLGYKVIYDVHEDVPKQVLNKQWIPSWLRPFISKLIERQEQKASKDFAGIICATEIIAARFKTYNSNAVAIHNYPILAELNNIAVDFESRDNSLCYLGSISHTRGIIPLINSLAESQLKLELAGIFSDSEIERETKTTDGFEHVHYHGILSRVEVAKLLSEVRVGMVTLLPTPSYIESLPIKLFEYMLAGIPVVASDFELWKPIVMGNNCGLMVDPNNPQTIAKACSWLIDNPLEAKKMGENGRRAVLANYVWEQEVKCLLRFYTELANVIH